MEKLSTVKKVQTLDLDCLITFLNFNYTVVNV